MKIKFFLITLNYTHTYIYILPIIYEKLPYTLYTSTILVVPWRWPGYMAETCRSCVYENIVQLVGGDVCVYRIVARMIHNINYNKTRIITSVITTNITYQQTVSVDFKLWRPVVTSGTNRLGTQKFHIAPPPRFHTHVLYGSQSERDISRSARIERVFITETEFVNARYDPKF